MIAVRDVVLLGHRTVGLDEDSAAELARIPEQLRRLDAVALVADSGARAGPLLTAPDYAPLHPHRVRVPA